MDLQHGTLLLRGLSQKKMPGACQLRGAFFAFPPECASKARRLSTNILLHYKAKDTSRRHLSRIFIPGLNLK